jgi:hypothetical protein
MKLDNNSNQTSFVTVFQDNGDSGFVATAQTYQHSTYVPAGLLEEVTLRWKGTSATELCTGDYVNLISQYIGRINGNQFANLNSNAGGKESATVGRISAIIESVGGSVTGLISATSYDFSVNFPVGLNLPNQSRYEGELRTLPTLAGVVPTATTFQVVFKYGFSSLATIYGNSTTENISAQQTMVQVKVPNFGAGTKVIGVAIQEPAETTKITGIVCQALGNFNASPAEWRQRSGLMGGNQYYYQDAATGRTVFEDKLLGFLFIPTYGLDTSATGQLTFLVTASEAVANVQFMPILSLPTNGAGQREAKQTMQKSTSGAGMAIERAEQ